MTPRIGIDLGGTKIEGVVIDAAGALLARERVPTPRDRYDDTIAAIAALVAQRDVSVDEAAATFTRARRDLVLRHLETLALMGEITLDADGHYHMARKAD
jgi:activator of 2-hydroxyglutaryl-CoA dehydratase